MSILGALVGGALSLFGSSRENKNNVENYEAQREDEIEDLRLGLSRLREGAELANINPLTALGSNHSNYTSLSTQRPAKLSSIRAIGPSVAKVVDLATDKFEERKAQQRKDEQLKGTEPKAKASGRRNATSGGQLSKKLTAIATRPVPVRAEDIGGVRPAARPGLWSKGVTPIIKPDGSPGVIPRKTADRLNIKPFDAMMVEDFSAILGDEVGQAVMTPQVPIATTQVLGGFLDRSVEDRQRILDAPFNPLSYIPGMTRGTGRPAGAPPIGLKDTVAKRSEAELKRKKDEEALIKQIWNN